MKSKLQKQEKGFTIIEVLIVLAIAGLIILIVFLAVPALQRNSRNTQRRDQAARYLSAINEFVNNNNGTVPSTAANITTINGLSNDGEMTEPTGAPVTGARTAALALNGMEVVTGARCDTTNVGQTVAGSTRNIALRFTVENSTGGAVGQCSEV